MDTTSALGLLCVTDLTHCVGWDALLFSRILGLSERCMCMYSWMCVWVPCLSHSPLGYEDRFLKSALISQIDR